MEKSFSCLLSCKEMLVTYVKNSKKQHEISILHVAVFSETLKNIQVHIQIVAIILSRSIVQLSVVLKEA